MREASDWLSKMRISYQPGGKIKLTKKITPKPPALKVNAEGIPEELKALRQWVCWKLVWDDTRWTKVPVNPKTGRNASSTKSSTWGTFDQAWEHYENHKGHGVDGLGFVFTKDDPFVGIDLDHCRDAKTGNILPWAMEIVERMNSFTEMSPSGEGLHIFVKGKLPDNGINTKEVEIYDTKRYFTVTGHAYDAN